MSDAPLPVLLPTSAVPKKLTSEWQPTRYLQPPMPPPVDEHKQDLAMAAARQLLDGKALKKTRPRRTVDYGGSMGRWILNRKSRPDPRYVPYIRPTLPCIIDLLPPKAYPGNPSTSLTTKFVHTSTNKIRCPVNCVVWTPEGRRVLTGSTSGEFTLWNGLTFNFETILQAHDTAVRALTFTRSGAYLVSADQSGVLKYFQPNMNNLTAWQAHREAVRAVSFAPDDRRFATASDDATVRIWDFEERREERALSGHGWDVRCVQWHPTKGLLVSGSKDNLVKFWDPRSGTCLSTLHNHKNTIQAVAWSPNGDLVATASRDQTVRLFDIRAMKEFRILKGHKKEVCSLAWHPVHPLLVSGGSEGSLLYWDVDAYSPETSSGFATSATSDGPRATLAQAHDSNVWSLAFHPLGHLLVSASNDHTTRFWARERPGDAASVFSGGGARPPDRAEDVDQEDEDQDQEEAMAVPGFAFLGSAAGGGVQGQWWGKDEEHPVPGLSLGGVDADGMRGRVDGMVKRELAGAGAGVGTGLGGGGGGIPGLGATADDFSSIPGFGSAQPAQQHQQQQQFAQMGTGVGGGGGGGLQSQYHPRGGPPTEPRQSMAQGSHDEHGDGAAGYRERERTGGRGHYSGGRGGSRWGQRRGGRH